MKNSKFPAKKNCREVVSPTITKKKSSPRSVVGSSGRKRKIVSKIGQKVAKVKPNEMASVNHDPIYDSPPPYGENLAKKQVKIDTRQTNIEKIKARKTKVSERERRKWKLFGCESEKNAIITLIAGLSASTYTKASQDCNVHAVSEQLHLSRLAPARGAATQGCRVRSLSQCLRYLPQYQLQACFG